MTEKKHTSSKRQELINAALRPKSPRASSFATAVSVAVRKSDVQTKPKLSPLPTNPFDFEADIRDSLICIYAKDMSSAEYQKAENHLFYDMATLCDDIYGDISICDDLDKHIHRIRDELIDEGLILTASEKHDIDSVLRENLLEFPNAEETVINHTANQCKKDGDTCSFDDITTYVEARAKHIRKDLEQQGLIKPKSRWGFLMRPF